MDCDRVVVEHQGSQGRLIKNNYFEMVAASSPPRLQKTFVLCISRTVRRLRLVSNNANSVDNSTQLVHGKVPVVVSVVNMAMDDSGSDICESVHGDANPLFNQNTSNTETIDGREKFKWDWRIQCPVLTPQEGWKFEQR